MVGFNRETKLWPPMLKVNLFSQILANISREKFDTLVKKHQSDKHNKGLKSWTHVVNILLCHIGDASSVRDISNGLSSTTGNLSHLGISRVPCKSSLSYMNKYRFNVRKYDKNTKHLHYKFVLTTLDVSILMFCHKLSG